MMSGSAAWAMVLVVLLLVIAGGAALVVVFHGFSPSSAGASMRDGPQEPEPASRILRERLARGEIDGPEYESRLLLIQRDEVEQ
jgi:uncharacterized membrane protein